MNDAHDGDTVMAHAVVHAVGEVGQEGPANGPGDQRELPGILLDAPKSSIQLVEEAPGSGRGTTPVPVQGSRDFGLGYGL
jgi:hypothetical protein